MVYGSHMHVRIPRIGEQSGCRDRDRAVLLRFGNGLRGAPVFFINFELYMDSSHTAGHKRCAMMDEYTVTDRI